MNDFDKLEEGSQYRHAPAFLVTCEECGHEDVYGGFTPERCPDCGCHYLTVTDMEEDIEQAEDTALTEVDEQ